jgi:hypothetical protein
LMARWPFSSSMPPINTCSQHGTTTVGGCSCRKGGQHKQTCTHMVRRQAVLLLHLCSQACCCLSCHKGYGTTVAERSPCLACPGPQLLFPLPRTRGC